MICSRAILASLALAAAGALAAIPGCAHAPATPPGGPAATALSSSPQTQQDPNSLLALDDLPPVALPAPRVPTTQDAGPAPLESVKLYARARQALLDDDRDTAIDLLEKAIAIDPDTFQLHYELAKLYGTGNGPNDQATRQFLAAADIRPGDIRVQTTLGREFLLSGQTADAIVHLRLARMTDDYRRQDDSAAVVDFFLGRALETAGYDRAAMDSYNSLLKRLQNPTDDLRANNEIGFLVAHPEVVYVQIGDLYAKHGQYAEAAAAFAPAADNDPSNFDLQSKEVRALALAGQRDQAIGRASDLVTRFRASADSISLLREICRTGGREQDAIDELKKLYQGHPDRALLLALSDTLLSLNRASDAEQVLQAAIDADPSNIPAVKALFQIYDARDQVDPATRLVVTELAARPESLDEISALWQQLLHPARRNELHITQLQKLDVPPSAQAAKLYLVSQIARQWRRDILARTSLEQSVKFAPPFAPSFRERVGDIWALPDFDDAQKISACGDLAASADAAGDTSLADEVRGLSLLHQNQPAAAVDQFAKAVALAPPPPGLSIMYASAEQLTGNDDKCEQTLWKVVGDFPQNEDAWEALFRFYLRRGATEQALKVLNQWLASDPASIPARVLQSSVFAQVGNAPAARDIIDRLFAEHGDDSLVVSSMFQLYRDTGKLDDFISRLEDRHNAHPDDRNVTQWLVEIYSSQQRYADAARVLDSTRAAVARDPDALYTLAHYYQDINQPNVCEDILRQVIKLDPTNPAACNDLGYLLADAGKDLPEAERLIRIAVDAEPDNQSFLDSLGWVLYKRSKFAESRVYMEKAIGPAALPDPVVLDHYGDVLYRGADPLDAGKQWKRSLDRIGEEDPDREDLKALRLELQTKIKQADAHQPVAVPPIGGG